MCCCVSCRGVISPTDKHIPTDSIWEMTFVQGRTSTRLCDSIVLPECLCQGESCKEHVYRSLGSCPGACLLIPSEQHAKLT